MSVPYKGGRYYPPIRGEEDLSDFRRIDTSYLKHAIRSAVLAIMLGFIFIFMWTPAGIWFGIMAIVFGLYANHHGEYGGLPIALLGLLLLMISSVLFVAYGSYLF